MGIFNKTCPNCGKKIGNSAQNAHSHLEFIPAYEGTYRVKTITCPECGTTSIEVKEIKNLNWFLQSVSF